ncbi:MAG: 1-acyl-sn-glycerol-3-phosphate acyltransferase [Chloroflexi bacterium]|nr:MAG: 1-acyl-sn-glycerol-3-phosphate acyltransferase [Chloroflexota bacterium]TMG72196.1 MAG: 1-acyl-sn-glycerol-3-phosphate acyltransferase [Chloroflexota bacterium]
MSARADTAVLPEERLWLWRIGFPPVRALAAFLCPWRLERGDRVPKVGGYILVANHVNWKDPPWIEFALGRAIRYMGKRELFEVPVIGYVLRSIGAFPVRRGEVDRGALHMAESVIEAGQPLGFFPEGHRSESGALIRGRNGVGYVALRTNAPIILIAVVGTKRARLGAFWRRDILLRVGEPFRASDLGSNDAQIATDVIMRRLAELLPDEMRGVYRDAPTGGAH